MASIKTDSGKWVKCTYEDAKEYAEYLRKRFSRLSERERETKVRERILLTAKEYTTNEAI